jgi:hypothetical protein
MLNQEQIEQLKSLGYDDMQIEKLEKAFIKLSETFIKVVNAIVKVISSIVNWLHENKKYIVGYKRLMKMEKLRYYESISYGKSNNWRKIHGLCLIRKVCL